MDRTEVRQRYAPLLVQLRLGGDVAEHLGQIRASVTAEAAART